MRSSTRRLLATVVAAASLLTAELGQRALAIPPAAPPPAAGPGNPCRSGAPARTFTIHAIETDVVYNKYGLHDPAGRLFVLAENRDRLLEEVAANPGRTVSLVQPLTIRASVGECIEVTLVNELTQPASIHPTGVTFDVLGSDGLAAGFNPDSTAAPGATVHYRWYVAQEGAFFFDSGADPTYATDPAQQKGSRAHGLFGALIAEPPGATWTDRRTGAALLSGVQADVHVPGQPSFRENVIFYHDGVELLLQDGSRPLELNGEIAHHYVINYRGDPDHLRYREDCPDCAVESQFYNSWVHGDPGGGDLVFPVYKGDPVKFRVIGASVEESHVHHLHNHRWKASPNDPNSATIDSQTVGPGETFTEELTGGAGYLHGGAGDVLFHCHLFPHYFDGMWAIMRVLDKQRRDVMPLPDRTPLPWPTAASPGYPAFVGGSTGYRPPNPPDPLLRPATPVEQSALSALLPGAPFVDPCPAGAPLRQYSVAAIQLALVLNNAGDRVPGGRIFVPLEDEAAVLNGSKKPQPLVLRANRGDCVQVTLENHLPADDQPNDISMHIHYVAFDVLGGDGTSVGYNYDEGVRPGGKIRYRWYPNEEGTIFFHDHQSHSATRGAYGMLAVEPTGSAWLSPTNLSSSVTTGTAAVISPPNAPPFREYSLFYADQVPATDAGGAVLNPPPVPGSVHDHGVQAINYKNAPFYRRTRADPAHVFSSWIYGDPDTPTLEAYPNEPVRIRLIQGSNEELHNFVMHGLGWQRDVMNGDRAGQTISVSEYFNFDLMAGPAGVPERDYLYGSMVTDDLWSGMWGSFRVWGLKVPWLAPLPGTNPRSITPKELAKFYKNGSRVQNYQEANNPCPARAPQRAYDVVAFTADIPYNRYGDHDPYGIVYALAEDEAAMLSGAKPIEPLVLRANEGDCIVVRLANHLPAAMSSHTDHAEVPVESTAWRNSSRISLHAQLVKYDVETADGAAVGWNFDSTVGPGETKVYRWYAYQEVGTSVLWDMADPRSHRHHGAYGMLVVEPRGATYRDPRTGQPVRSGTVADILLPGGQSFREFALLFSDGAYVVNPDGACVLDDEEGDPSKPCNQQGEPDEQGFKGVNYRSEPFPRRLPADESAQHPCRDATGTTAFLVTGERIWYRATGCGAEPDSPLIFSEPIPDKHLIFSSHVYGDPSTPVFRAYAGDPVRIRLASVGDKARGVSFHLGGHVWPYDWRNPQSPVNSVQGRLTPGVVADLLPLGGAGGTGQRAGDYLYQDLKLRGYLEGGLWGLVRVLGNRVPDLLPLPTP